MTSPTNDESDLSEELRQLGVNLKEALRSAWESEERKKLQEEIETGLQSLGSELQKAADEIDIQGIGREVKGGIEDANQKIQSGEFGNKVRAELLGVLQTINTELRDARSKWSSSGSPEDAEDS
jgi:hypothetical protein